MDRVNIIIGGVCFLLGVVLLLLIPSQVSSFSSNPNTLGADFFPKFVGGLMIFASCGLLLETILARRLKKQTHQKIDSEWNKEKRVIVIFLLLFIYAALLNILGFIVGSILCGVAMMWLLKVRTWWFYGIYILSVFVTYILFSKILYVHLPVFSLFG